jgi:hypothetical protein
MNNSDPNATVAGGTTGAGVLVVWLLGYFGVSLSAEIGAAIAGGAATVLLVIGRRGIKGTLQRIWQGSGGK